MMHFTVSLEKKQLSNTDLCATTVEGVVVGSGRVLLKIGGKLASKIGRIGGRWTLKNGGRWTLKNGGRWTLKNGGRWEVGPLKQQVGDRKLKPLPHPDSSLYARRCNLHIMGTNCTLRIIDAIQ